MRYFVAGFLFGILMLSGIGFAQESGKPFITIGTGGTTGVYYAAGHAVAKVFARTVENQSFRLDAEASKGSVENINKVLSGEFAFGIAQADALYKAEHGSGRWEGMPHDNLRAVAALFPEAITIAVAVNAKVDTIKNLKGKKVSIGENGSGGEQSARTVLRLYGLNPETDLTLVESVTIDATEQLQEGLIDAFFYVVGHPNLAIREATFGDRKMKLIGIDPAIVDEASKRLPYLVHADIPVNYYPALQNKQPVPTVGVKAILFTSKQTPDATVAAILQALLDDFGRFQRQHPAFAKLSPNDLLKGVILPLHPAAEAVYRKEGLK